MGADLIGQRVGGKMRIATWNIGGIRKRRNELMRWLRDNDPDVMGLQEVRAKEENFRELYLPALEAKGYRVKFHVEPRWNGVAILSKQNLEVIQCGLPGQERRGSRLLSARTSGLWFTTVCVPVQGKVWGMKGKLAWLDALSKFVREGLTEDMPAVLCGDFNINPTPMDNYHRWEGIKKEDESKAGFQDEERSRIRSLLEAGWCDLVREKNPGERMFSWWCSNSHYEEDKGLRIDLVLGNGLVAERRQSAWIDREHCSGYEESERRDHAPVVVDLA